MKTVTLRGSCLCQGVKFEIDVPSLPLKLYQCHCTLCQKQSGSTSNTATIVQQCNFRWISSTMTDDAVSKWQKESGFTSHFCKICGCPTPNQLRNLRYYWIPMGLIDNDNDDGSSGDRGGDNAATAATASASSPPLLLPQIVTHLCVNSKAPWDNTNSILSSIINQEIEEQEEKPKDDDGLSPPPKVKVYDEMPTNLDEFINDIV